MDVPECETPHVIALLRSLGATDVQLAEAAAHSGLPALAADLTLARPFVLTARDVAERLGITPDDVAATVRVMGLPAVDPDAPAFTEADLALLGLGGAIGSDLVQVMAASLTRLADAAVASYVQRDETALAERQADALEWAKANAAVGELALRLADGLGSMWLHYLREAIDWQRRSQRDVPERQLARVAVGFVDLVGFTPLTRRLDPAQLVEVVTRFEATAFEVAVAHGGRIVKHIGDEIMFVALDAGVGCRIAVALCDAFAAASFEPRGGLAFGEALVLHGDYYGTVVNLASRLADEAIPGEVLVDDATAEADKDAGVAFAPAGRRRLRGFDHPVTVWSLTSADALGAPERKR